MREWPGHPDPGETFILKVDPKNGDSSAFSLSSSDPAPGRAIDTHRHPGADEILFLHTGIARVHLRDSVRVVHAGATEFIPANTWISVDNIENDVIYLVGILSEPGFKEFMRDGSVREGRKNVPVQAQRARCTPG